MRDEDLVAAARRGDHDAFRELVQRYQSIVARTVIAMLGNCEEAEDVGQETFVRFYESLDRFRGEASLKTYLTRIAMNLSLNAIKRGKIKRRIFATKSLDEYNQIPNPAEQSRLDTELIHKAIQKLEPKFRSVLVLRLIDGYSTRETAEILGIPLGTVLSRLARAQQKLRQLLEPYLEDLL